MAGYKISIQKSAAFLDKYTEKEVKAAIPFAMDSKWTPTN